MTIKNVKTGEILMNFDGIVEIKDNDNGIERSIGMHTTLMAVMLRHGMNITKWEVIKFLIKCLFKKGKNFIFYPTK